MMFFQENIYLNPFWMMRFETMKQEIISQIMRSLKQNTAMQPCTLDDICRQHGLSVYVEFYGVLVLRASTIAERMTQSYFRRVSGLFRGGEVKTCLKTKITFFFLS